MFDRETPMKERLTEKVCGWSSIRHEPQVRVKKMADTKRSRTIICLFVAVLAGAAIVNCGTSQTASGATDESNRFYERAQGYLAKGELQSAVIELKNSVRADPANAAARYALGLVLLRTGDAASAESQLKAAREQGFDEAKVLEPLARSLI